MLVVAVMLILADLVTTLIGIRIARPDAEDNPLWRQLITRWGRLAFAAAHLTVMGGIVLAASLLGDGALAGFVAVLALVVLNNLYVLWRLRKRRLERGS